MSMKGVLNSIALSRIEDMVKGAIAISASFLTSSPTKPFLSNNKKLIINLLYNKQIHLSIQFTSCHLRLEKKFYLKQIK